MGKGKATKETDLSDASENFQHKKIIALVGRPNVGKSTLFNRLSYSKKAIVHDKAGVTRDRKYADAKIGPLEFTLIDTPGLEESEEGKLEYRMMQQTIAAVAEADLTCLILDGKIGVTPSDIFFAKMVRQYSNNYLLIVNKCEKVFDFHKEYFRLGFGAPIAISAEHAHNMMGLYESIIEKLESMSVPYILGPRDSYVKAGISDALANPISSKYLQIVVAGKPNAGKSTFINNILGQERLLTGPEAGITRESIEVEFEHNGQRMKLIDSAGMRKKSAIIDNLEKLSVSDAIGSIRFANTVILMMDATKPLEQQDLNIASHVINEGRALILVVNKWDLMKNKEAYVHEFDYQLEKHLPQVKGVPVLYISALSSNDDAKDQVRKVLDKAIEIYKIWNKKIPTSKLNDWLNFALDEHQLPLIKGGRRLRIKYMTQIKTRPPSFKLFSNSPDEISQTYIKYLINSLRENFNMPGVPIRFQFDKSENPYVSRKKKK